MSTFDEFVSDAPAAMTEAVQGKPRSRFWRGAEPGDWIWGVLMGSQERLSQFKGNDGEDRYETHYLLYAVQGSKDMPKPKSAEALFKHADLIPVSDSRAGLRNVFQGCPVKNRGDQPGVQEGDLILIKFLGRPGDAFEYAGLIREVDDLPDVPEAAEKRADRWLSYAEPGPSAEKERPSAGGDDPFEEDIPF